MKKRYIHGLLMAFLYILAACSPKESEQEMQVAASSDKQWTGVAVSNEGRIFTNFPTWSADVPIKVAKIVNGKAVAFPKDQELFSAVQSVVVDAKNRLWILDTRNPQFRGVLEGGPVLFLFDPETGKKEKTYTFSEEVYKENSYFNDVRVDTQQEVAYMTDSGNGALIVLDLKTGANKRVLDDHPSTHSEVDHLICDGIRWENTVHADGIALTPDRKYLYFIALTGHTLYRIPTDLLNDESLTNAKLGEKVEKVATIPATDGMLFDRDGNLWLGGLENNSVNLLKKEGKLEKVVQDEIIRWADSFAADKDGNIYFTTSQIHLPEDQRKEYQIIKLVR